MKESDDEMVGRLVLGRYRIVQRLARGGMGVVYLARAEGAAGFVKPAVVKRVLPDLTGDDSMMRMFIREARILSHLHHPGIVDVLDFGEEGGAYIMVLDYVHGYHVGRWHRYVRKVRGLFPAQIAIQIVLQVLDSLHYAHSLTRPDGKPLNIVHRDISPSNILVDHAGHVRLVDFGIARMTGETAEYKTEDITLKGKFPYLAPELFKGKPPSVQTDVYACGVVLHELLVGRNEFRGKEMSETLSLVLRHSPSELSTVRNDVPPRINEVLGRSLTKSPDDRYKTADDFARDLRAAREASEEECSALMKKETSRDFTDEMAQILDVHALSELDLAWREPVALPSSPPTEIDADIVPPIEVEALEAPALPPAPSPKRNGAAWISLAAVVLAAAAAGVAVMTALPNSDTPQENGDAPRFILVQPGDQTADSNRRPGIDTTQLDTGPVDPTPSDTTDPTKTKTKRRTKRRGPSLGQSLAAPLRRRHRRFQACFQKHVANIEGAPKIFVRLTINTSGSVDKAELLPATINATPLGACLLGVARGTNFGARDQEVTFRVPITAGRQ